MQGVQANNKRIAKNTAFLYIRMLLVLFVSLFTTRVVINALGVENYGINNVVAGFVSMFTFLNSSMSNGIQRFYNFHLGRDGDSSITKVYNTSLIIQGILAIIIVVLLETIGLWYLNHRMVIPNGQSVAAQWIYQFSVISLVLVIMQVPYCAAIMANEQMDFYAYVSIFEVLSRLVIAFIIKYVTGDILIFYGALCLLVTLFSSLLYFLYAKIKTKELVFEKSFHKDLFRSMLTFSGWNIFGTFAYMLKGQGLNILLNAFFGVIVNTARGIAYMIMGAIQGLQSNIVISFRPQLVQSYAGGEYGRVKSLMYSMSKISYILLFLFSLPIIIEIKYILTLWLGDIVPDYTIPFTILVLVNMIISSLNTPLSQVVHATGKMKSYQMVTSIVICSILPISWVALKLGGNPVSVFWVSLIVTIFNQVICMLYLKKIFTYSIREYIKEVIIPCLILSILTPLFPIICRVMMPESFIRVSCVCLLEIVSVCIISYYLVLNRTERQIVIGFIKRLIKRK